MKSLNINFELLEEGLSKIGGHKTYHLEGNAWRHTCLVVEAMMELRPNDALALKLAYLHDIGKIYTSICHGENNWEYPDHSTCGGFRGILCKFIPEDDPDFKALQWYISNHIKPLFWMKNGVNTSPAPKGIHVDMSLLRDMAIADILGSVSVEPQTELIKYLKSLTF